MIQRLRPVSRPDGSGAPDDSTTARTAGIKPVVPTGRTTATAPTADTARQATTTPVVPSAQTAPTARMTATSPTSPAAPAESPALAMPGRFADLPLSDAMVRNLDDLGYEVTTPIQAATLPATLEGQDLLAQARTGSGKTAAFGLPLLARLSPRWFAVQALVLCPTRELAEQVAQELRRLARAIDNIKVLSLCGGTPMRPQMASLAYGAHVVVGTPGRVIDHLQRGSLPLDGLKIAVLDEADRMLDMGFHDDIAWILSQTPATRQTLMFSATYPPGVDVLTRALLRSPLIVRLDDLADRPAIRQRFVRVDDDAERGPAIVRWLAVERPASALVFCNTRARCLSLADALGEAGIDALALHGELAQRERDEILLAFTHRSCPVLIATDVAARGLDIDALPAVINADLSPDPDTHLHRIGRTGRGETAGVALSLVGPRDTRRLAAAIRRSMPDRQAGPRTDAVSAHDPASASASLPPAVEDWRDWPQPGTTSLQAPMVTLQLLGGRKSKIRPADILGALTGELGFTREQIGRITIADFDSYVSVSRDIADVALERLNGGRLKGRPAKARRLLPGQAPA